MNYIYDIYLNINENLLDFFDWNSNDKLIHIKKIPIFKVNSDCLCKMINYKIKVDDDFINYIHNLTSTWNNNITLSYCALFCDNNDIIAINFDKNGNSIGKSSLLIDEELEILEICNRFKERNINLKLIKRNNINFKTRKQIKEENFVKNELNTIDKERLEYIYFECFNRHEKNIKNIINKIKRLEPNTSTYKNLYNVLKLTSKPKNKIV